MIELKYDASNNFIASSKIVTCHPVAGIGGPWVEQGVS
jgi:hypothetical protein